VSSRKPLNLSIRDVVGDKRIPQTPGTSLHLHDLCEINFRRWKVPFALRVRGCEPLRGHQVIGVTMYTTLKVPRVQVDPRILMYIVACMVPQIVLVNPPARSTYSRLLWIRGNTGPPHGACSH
jgi:hypothetical protein